MLGKVFNLTLADDIKLYDNNLILSAKTSAISISLVSLIILYC